jgi:hypothetical protein
MNSNYLIENSLKAAFESRLREIVDQLRANRDVAPAQRLQLEGMAAALIAAGIDVDALAQICSRIGADFIVATRIGNALHFDCWQQRAPVYPSAKT